MAIEKLEFTVSARHVALATARVDKDHFEQVMGEGMDVFTEREIWDYVISHCVETLEVGTYELGDDGLEIDAVDYAGEVED